MRIKQDRFKVYVCAKSLQSHAALCDPMDCGLPGSSVHGILQARILRWVAIPSSRGSCWPTSPAWQEDSFLHWATWEVHYCLWMEVNDRRSNSCSLLTSWPGLDKYIIFPGPALITSWIFLVGGRGGEGSSMSIWEVLCVNFIVLHRYKLFFSRPFIFSYC